MHARRRLALFTIFLVTAFQVSGQSDPNWYLNRPIQSIEFTGLESVKINELTGITDPFVGKPFTEPTFLDLQRRLYALDYFEQIIPNAVKADAEGTAVIIEFQVKERPVIIDIEFTGNRRIGKNQLLDVILLKRGDMITRGKLRVDEEAIRSLYLERGFPAVTVSSEFVEENAENIVRFTITEGNQISIEAIQFIGNNFASDSSLRGVVESKVRNIFNKGLFQASLVQSDRNRIEAWYHERGYIDARVVDVEQTLQDDPEESRQYLTLRFLIEEGIQWTYGGVAFDGNTIFTDQALNDLIRLEPGEIIDLRSFDFDYQRIMDRYYEDGYIFNQITREEIRDEAEQTVSFRINIVERGRAHIESIVFRGNEKTQDFVLYRELPLEVGDVFSATRIREGLQNLANLQYFSAVTPETPAGSADGLMDLIINVEESTTADISFGVAFGGNQEFPVSAQIQWQDRNFLGRGQTFGIQGVASPLNQQVSFNFLERWLMGRRWSGGFNLVLEHSVVTNIPQDSLYPQYDDEDVPDPFVSDRYVFTTATPYNGVTYSAGDYFPGIPTTSEISDYSLESEWDYLGRSTAEIPSENRMEYDAYTISIGANTGYTFRTPFGRLTPRTSARTGINYITYDDTVYRASYLTTRENLDRWRFKNSWTLGASLDNRDFIYSPSSGYYFDQSFGFTGGILGGQRHYTRVGSTAEGFMTLWEVPARDWTFKMVLGAHSELNMVVPNFYLNASNGRYYALETSDFLRIDGMFNARGWPYESGGWALWNNWVELRMPISEQVIWFDTFFEGTYMATGAEAWAEREKMQEMVRQDWLFSLGSGIRFVIPQFPIRLYMAKRFQFDDAGNVEWQTGNLFNNGGEDGRGLELVFTIGAEFF